MIGFAIRPRANLLLAIKNDRFNKIDGYGVHCC